MRSNDNISGVYREHRGMKVKIWSSILIEHPIRITPETLYKFLFNFKEVCFHNKVVSFTNDHISMPTTSGLPCVPVPPATHGAQGIDFCCHGSIGSAPFIMMTSWYGNDFSITGSLWGESTDSSPKGPVMWRFDFFFAIKKENLLNKHIRISG